MQFSLVLLVLVWTHFLQSYLHIQVSQRFSTWVTDGPLLFHPPQKLLQSPWHWCWTPTEEMWSRRRKNGVQAAGTSLQRLSREWERAEMRERGVKMCRGEEGVVFSWKEVNEAGNSSKQKERGEQACIGEYRKNWWKITLSLTGNKKWSCFLGSVPASHCRGMQQEFKSLQRPHWKRDKINMHKAVSIQTVSEFHASSYGCVHYAVSSAARAI